MLRYILLAFTIYFAYRFIVNFLIPVVKTTRQVKKQFDSVREQQAYQQEQQRHQHQEAKPSPVQKDNKASDNDYLEFEEIK
jgi:Sec-independent protein translocase protein TatA